MIEENLHKLGFSPSEIKVYLHLLKIGSSYPGKISSLTRINRTNIYEALDRLVSKGVVSYIIKNKIKWFEAKSPNSILSLINEKEQDLKQTRDSLIKEVSNLHIESNKLLEANIFIGKKGLRMIFEDILETKRPIALIAAEPQFKKLFGPYFELWHKRRIENNISQRSIIPMRFKPKLKQRKLLTYKFVNNKFTNPTTTIVYGETCLLIQWSKEPIAIKINNTDIAKSHLNYFNMLWKS